MPPLRWLCCAALYCAALWIAPQAQANQNLAMLSVNAIFASLSNIITALLLLCLAGLLWLQHKQRRRLSTLSVDNQLFDGFLHQSDDYIALLDQQLHAEFINPALRQQLNVTAETPANLLPLYPLADSAEPLLPQLDLTKPWHGEAWLQTPSGRVALSVSITLSTPPTRRYLLLARDISAVKQQQQQLTASYLQDAATGLFSQALLAEYLHTLIHISNTSRLPFAVMLVKLNRLLHSDNSKAGADLATTLNQFSSRLSELVQKGCVLARYNTDTIAILVPPHLCQDNSELRLNRLGHRVLKLAEQTAASLAIQLQTTIGISVYSADSDSASELMLAASGALVEAAKAGHSRMVFADEPLGHRSSEYLSLEAELYKAVAQDEFELYYQPRISIGSNRVVGYEALLRWHNPRRGILLPQYFLSIADEAGLSVQLDRISFVKCCSQLLLWQKIDIDRGRMSLNISSLSLQQSDFIAFLQTTMSAHNLSAEAFELELHEDALLQQDAISQSNLQQLAAQGFHLTLDNFGEGISSLSALRRHTLHSLKIAQSYIKDMEHNEQQRNITASLIRLASYLQLDVIASGIENEMQAYLLHVMGCDILQGHLFSKAIPAADIPALLAKENRFLRNAVS